MVPPQAIAAAIGAIIGAGKTALNKDTRKDWKAYVMNTLSGAAAGASGGMGAGSGGAAAMGGAMGALGGGGMGTPPTFGGDLDGGPGVAGGFGDLNNNSLLRIFAQNPMNSGLQEGEMDYDDPSLPKGPIIKGGVHKPGPIPGGKDVILSDFLKSVLKKSGEKSSRETSMPAINFPPIPQTAPVVFNPIPLPQRRQRRI